MVNLQNASPLKGSGASRVLMKGSCPKIFSTESFSYYGEEDILFGSESNRDVWLVETSKNSQNLSTKSTVFVIEYLSENGIDINDYFILISNLKYFIIQNCLKILFLKIIRIIFSLVSDLMYKKPLKI